MNKYGINPAGLIDKIVHDLYQDELTEKVGGLENHRYPNHPEALKYDMNELMKTMRFSYQEDIAPPQNLNGSFMRQNHFDAEKVRGDFPILKQNVNGKPLIWFDNAATTQKPQIVIDRIVEFYSNHNSNIHRGYHSLSNRSTDIYENTRKLVGQFIGADEKEIIFVRGATEGLNLIANTYGNQHINSGDEILVSVLEHHSNILPWQSLCKRTGAKMIPIPIDRNGDIIIDQYASLLSSRTKLVAITHVSNAIGTVVPIDVITSMAHRYGAVVVVDGAQSIPHIAVDVKDLDCDFFVASGHKLYGPNGIGFVYGKESILSTLPPWQLGGGIIKHVSFERTVYEDSPRIFEAGTGSIGDVAGLGAAIEYLNQIGMHNVSRYENELLSYAMQELNSIQGLSIVGDPTTRAGMVPFILKNKDMTDLVSIATHYDQYGIALRVGKHCAQPLIKVFNLDGWIRPSFSFYNTKKEIDVLVQATKDYAYAKNMI